MGGRSFLKRTFVAAAITGAVGALAAASRWGAAAGTGFAVGLIWGLTNLGAMSLLLRAMTDPDRGARGRLPVLVGLKLLLYGAGIGLLASGWFSLPAMVAGFTWLLAVLALRAAGAMWMRSGSRGAGTR